MQEVRKAEEKAKRDLEAEEATKKRAEEAKKVTISEDKTLPAAEKVKISHLEQKRGERVKVRIKKIIFSLVDQNPNAIKCRLTILQVLTCFYSLLKAEIAFPQ